MRDVVITAGARTPIGSFLGALSRATVAELGAAAIGAAVERAGVAPDAVGLVNMGCVLQAGAGQAPARIATLAAGLPDSTPAVTTNKACGSGLESVIQAARAIAAGEVDVAVAGGMESMSQSPHLVRMRTGVRMGAAEMQDAMLHDGLWDPHTDRHMGGNAEICARERGISREDQDAHAAESYRRALAAQATGRFAGEIVPVTVRTRHGETVVATDEDPGRGDIARLPSLHPAFDPDGTITAGNASSINDGAAAVVLMSADEAGRRGAPVLARIVASGVHAQAPEWFTTAPAGAITAAADRAGWTVADVDLWEINEAFSVVSVANNRILGLDPDRVNVHGGAVALGHPVGASGTRILVTLLAAMAGRGARRGCASLCIGGGEGIALMVERP